MPSNINIRQTATITYEHPDRGPEDRLITPSHIFLGMSRFHSETKHACWYLQAWCHDKKGNRHFPMTHISNWREGDHRTSPDAQPEAA